MHELYQAGMALGGAISGEHGIGTLKKEYFLALENPDKLDLLRRIKTAFDPNKILNPGVVFDWPAQTHSRPEVNCASSFSGLPPRLRPGRIIEPSRAATIYEK